MDFSQLPTLFKDVGEFKCKLMRITHTLRYPALWFEVLIRRIYKNNRVPTMRVVSKYPVTPVPYPGPRGSPDHCLSETHIWGHCSPSQWIRPYALRFLYTVERTSRHHHRSVHCRVIHYFVVKFARFVNLNKDQLFCLILRGNLNTRKQIMSINHQFS